MKDGWASLKRVLEFDSETAAKNEKINVAKMKPEPEATEVLVAGEPQSTIPDDNIEINLSRGLMASEDFGLSSVAYRDMKDDSGKHHTAIVNSTPDPCHHDGYLWGRYKGEKQEWPLPVQCRFGGMKTHGQLEPQVYQSKPTAENATKVPIEGVLLVAHCHPNNEVRPTFAKSSLMSQLFGVNVDPKNITNENRKKKSKRGHKCVYLNVGNINRYIGLIASRQQTEESDP